METMHQRNSNLSMGQRERRGGEKYLGKRETDGGIRDIGSWEVDSMEEQGIATKGP
jgi:hypothetical protein